MNAHHLFSRALLRSLFVLAAIGILALAYLVYSPGLSGPFAFDDSTNIQSNSALELKNLDAGALRQAAFSGHSGMLKRPLSMLSLGLDYYWADGFSPYYFKITNLFIHLLNGVLLFFLISEILGIYRLRFQPQLQANYLQWVSLAAAAAWLLHPLCLTSVLYVVQRMTSLSALFTFAGLIFYLRGRRKLFNGEPGGIAHVMAGLLVCLPLATLSKESGILLPVFMLVLEVTLFNFETPTVAAKRFLFGFYGLTIAIPAVVILVYLTSHPDFILGGYRWRDFTLPERLLTEPRVLWFYLKMILLPKSEDMGLFHDDIPVSHGLFEPVATFPAAILLLALGTAGFIIRKRYPIVALGLLFFFAGHLLESTIIPLDIAFEHRNYVPMAGIILIPVFYLLHPLASPTTLRLRQASMVLLLGLLAGGTAIRAGQWSNLFLLTTTEVAHHPNSYRANAEMGAMYGRLAGDEPDHSSKYFLLSRQHFEKAAELNKNNTDGLFGLIYFSSKLNRAIEPGWVDGLLWRLKYAPFTVMNTDKLYLLEGCLEAGECHLSKDVLRSLLDAALQNATLDAEQKARLLTTLGVYYANVEQDDKNALAAMQAAVAASPTDPNYRANLVSYLISRNQPAEARKELTLAKELDVYGIYKHQFSEQEQLINSANAK